MQNWLSFMDKAGPTGLIIVITSIIALVIVLDRLWCYRCLRIRDTRTLHRMRKRAVEGDFSAAAAEAAGESHPLYTALTEVLSRLRESRRTTRAELEKTIVHISAREVRNLERFLPTLFLISTVAPLLGMFGTVMGMIRAFQTIQELGGKVNASVLAGGLWEAMLTTALGLAVAIPSMVAHNLLQGRVHQTVADIREESGALLDAIEDTGALGSTPLPRPGTPGRHPHTGRESA
jgi:biopolymer transport protein ExbB